MTNKQLPYFDKIVGSFDTDPKASKTPKTVWRVKINGQYIATVSGKTVWKRIGDAKNAVHNHIQDWLYRIPYGSRNYSIDSGHYMHEMMKQGVLEFVELPVG